MRRRVVWLIGPMGVGKSTTGWRAQRATAGASVFLDADQVGLCYPAPADDPQQHGLKAGNLAALEFSAETWFVAAGFDDDPTWARYRDALPAREVVVCRLRADTTTLRTRILGRGGPLVRFLDQAIESAAALDALTFPDVVVDTSGETAAASLPRVLRALEERRSA